MPCALTTAARLGLLPVLATLGLLSGCEDAPEHIRSEATRPNAVAQGRADTTQPADTAQPADTVPDITPDTLADAPPTDTALPDTASPDADSGPDAGLDTDTDTDLDTGSDTCVGQTNQVGLSRTKFEEGAGRNLVAVRGAAEGCRRAVE